MNYKKNNILRERMAGEAMTTTYGLPGQSGGMTRAELLDLPVVVSVATAARALGLGRSTAYELARRGEFPCRVLHIGSSYRVPTADLLRVLGIDPRETHGSSAA